MQYLVTLVTLKLRPEPSLEDVSEWIRTAEKIPDAERKNIAFLMGSSVHEAVLWKATFALGIPYNKFLAPPVTTCLECGCSLQLHHRPTGVICFNTDGAVPGLKVTLRCESCKLNYRYEQYGNNQNGYQFYSEKRPLVHASQVVYIDRVYCARMAAAG